MSTIDPPLPEFTAASFPDSPPLDCDIVMKGGITSGVIYPRAVCELATVYRLRSVGGASAGAIAAAAAAAAEYGRRSGGFAKFARFPEEMTAEAPGTGRSVLFGLFQPVASTRRLFGVLTAVLDGASAVRERRSRARALLALAGPLLRLFWRRALVAVLPGVLVAVLAVLVLMSGGPPLVIAGVIFLIVAILLMLLGLAVGISTGLLDDARGLPANGFGLCTGMPEDGSAQDARTGVSPALSPWLHEKLQDLAGLAENRPLTFGDLADADISLQMMTTNLSRRQPLTMPWDGPQFYFDVNMMRRYFPRAIVDWMEQHPPTWSADLPGAEALAAERPGLRPLPDPRHLPVIVATRMSLSFPVLISAVPLYRVVLSEIGEETDRGTTVAAQAGDPAVAVQEHWFTDGGLCSNLPVHFFDAPLPRHPTFAINLDEQDSVAEQESQNSYLVTDNHGGQRRRFYPVPAAALPDHRQVASLEPLKWFGSSLLDTARNWVDEAQLVLPGYRDRVVQIYHTKSEGGLNLTMAEDAVSHLSERGQRAAQKLVQQFAGEQPGWRPTLAMDNQRWVRFRASTAALSSWLDAYALAFRAEVPGATSYPEMLGQALDAATAPVADPLPYPLPPSYELGSAARQRAARQRTKLLLRLVRQWSRTPQDAFTHNRPDPPTSLRVVPYDGNVGLSKLVPTTSLQPLDGQAGVPALDVADGQG